TARSFALVCVGSAVLAGVGWGIWHLLDSGLGPSLPAQIVSLGAGLVLGYAAFFGVCRLLGVRELETLLRLRRRRACPSLVAGETRPGATVEPRTAFGRNLEAHDVPNCDGIVCPASEIGR